MKRDLRQWINLIEASRASRISRSDVMNRLRQLSYEDKITRKDILYAYHNIMRSAAFEGGRMVVYRGMNVEEPEWFTDLAPDTNLGRYWAYNRIGANAGSWDTPMSYSRHW